MYATVLDEHSAPLAGLKLVGRVQVIYVKLHGNVTDWRPYMRPPHITRPCSSKTRVSTDRLFGVMNQETII